MNWKSLVGAIVTAASLIIAIDESKSAIESVQELYSQFEPGSDLCYERGLPIYRKLLLRPSCPLRCARKGCLTFPNRQAPEREGKLRYAKGVSGDVPFYRVLLAIAYGIITCHYFERAIKSS